MLKIRLQRIGRKNAPAFRVVLVDSHASPKTGNFIEILGTYNPLTKAANFKAERIKEWMGKGAHLSDTLHNLLINQKIIEGKKVNVLPRKSPIKAEGEVAEAAAPAPEGAPAQEESPKEESPAPEEKAAEEPKQEEKTEEKTPESEEEKKPSPEAPAA